MLEKYALLILNEICNKICFYYPAVVWVNALYLTLSFCTCSQGCHDKLVEFVQSYSAVIGCVAAIIPLFLVSTFFLGTSCFCDVISMANPLFFDC